VAGQVKNKTVFNGEPEYAMHLAVHQAGNVDFLPAEPPTRFIVDRIGEFSVRGNPIRGEDVLFFYLFRGMPGLVSRESVNNNNDLDRVFPGFVRGAIRRYDFKKELAGVTMKDFIGWYENLTGIKFDCRNIPTNSPTGNNSISKINKYISYLRDVSILNHVTKAMESYDKIMVVYGNGHYCRLKPAFVKLFGPVKSEFQIRP
jgi:predicted AAA+ superfamily ATPase